MIQVHDKPLIRADLGSEHTDLFSENDATEMFDSCEDFYSGFHASLCGKDILLCKALVRAIVISVFM